jgi:autotransporter-associated beta strand protein
LTKSGAGILNIAGSNLHTGGTAITQGTLALSGGNALGDATAVTLSNSSGVVLAINASETIGSLRGGGSTGGATQIAAGQTLTVAETGTSTYAGQLAGSGSFTKSGAGTLTFASTSTGSHGGSTSVTAGTLLVDGNFSGATGAASVSSGATLGGSGTLGGATTLNSGAILSPGNGPGILSFGSSLALNDGSDIRMEINGSTRGTAYDAINVTGALTYDGNLQLTFGQSFGTGNHTFNLWSFGSQFGSFDSITLAGSYTGSLLNNSGIWSGSSGLDSFEFSQSTGSLSLTVAVPEPGTWALLAIAASFLLWRRRSAS